MRKAGMKLTLNTAFDNVSMKLTLYYADRNVQYLHRAYFDEA
jgi:hypothetical protein